MMGNELPILDDVLLDSFAMAPFPLSVAMEDVSYVLLLGLDRMCLRLMPPVKGRHHLCSNYCYRCLCPSLEDRSHIHLAEEHVRHHLAEEPFHLIQFPHLHVRHRQVLQSRQVLMEQFLVHTEGPLHLVNWISGLRLFRLLFSQPPVPAVTLPLQPDL
jgi:hypothetical protein